MIDIENLKNEWKKDESQAFSGWDFSYIDKRTEDGELAWDYRTKVLDFLKPNSKILDMGTGGGEFLLSLAHPYELTSVTEAWEPNFQLCMKRLAPMGITVKKSEDDKPLPYDDNSFDIVLNRHEDYNIEEVKRVLKPSGFFITQQVGGVNNNELSKFLISGFEPQMPSFNLENERPKFEKAGFRIMYRNQSYPIQKYFDIGALCYLAKIISWEFPGFSVDSCFDKLLLLQKRIEEQGFIESREHRFIIIAKNAKPKI